MKNSTRKKYIEQSEPYRLTVGQKIYVFLKTVMDVLFAVIGLTVCLLPFLVIAIAIKCDSKGPVFFVQERVGKKGKIYKIVKFRTMSADAPNVAPYIDGSVYSHVTKVGAFLRKTSLDELPQLFNILLGQMSFVGYRPAQENETVLNDTRRALDVYQLKPGVSGWAQVNGRAVLAENPELKAKYDAYYVRHVSFCLDVKIFFLTVAVVFGRKDVTGDGK